MWSKQQFERKQKAKQEALKHIEGYSLEEATAIWNENICVKCRMKSTFRCFKCKSRKYCSEQCRSRDEKDGHGQNCVEMTLEQARSLTIENLQRPLYNQKEFIAEDNM